MGKTAYPAPALDAENSRLRRELVAMESFFKTLKIGNHI